MTAPTSDRAQRIERVADALRAYDVREMNATEAATVLVDTLAPDTERLGGGERECVKKPAWPEPIASETLERVRKTLDEVSPKWIEVCDAIRTLAQTAKDARARAMTAENERADEKRYKEQYREMNERQAETIKNLRAQLDAMTGEQVPVGWGNLYKSTIGYVWSTQEAAERNSRTDATEIAVPIYRHPSPAARVEALPTPCVVADVSTEELVQELRKRNVSVTLRSTFHQLLHDAALTPNADGAK